MKSILILIMLGFVTLAGCSSTKLLTSWQDPVMQSSSFRKPLIIAITDKRILRVKLEDEFLKSFQKIGVDAVQSYKYFPEISSVTHDSVKNIQPTIGTDSVIVTHLVDTKLETINVPARTEVYGTGGGYGRPSYYGNFGSYYSNSYSVVTTPAYNYVEKKYIAETNIYETKDGKLVWTGITESEENSSLDKAITDFTKVIMKDIRGKMIY